MSNRSPQLPVLLAGSGKISRRDAARFLLSSAAAGFALLSFTTGHAVWRHIAFAALPPSAEAELASANWKPLFLTQLQEESVRALAEVMLPGSTEAQVSRFIDLLLSTHTKVVQQKFLGSLAGIDEEASSKFGKPFAKLTAPAKDSLLTAISSQPRSGDQPSRMRGHFEDLKEWMVPAYYSSEIGMRELGWTPDRVFSSFPVCNHPDGHT